MDRGEAGGRNVGRGRVAAGEQQECGCHARSDKRRHTDPRMTILEYRRNHGCHVSTSAPFKP